MDQSFSTAKTQELIYLTADLLTAAGVRHGFTTRKGGVSAGALASLNLGVSRGDNPENVRHNYARICAALGTGPENTVFSRQAHGDRIHVAQPDDAGFGLLRDAPWEADAYITDRPGLCLTVFTADCVPILLFDPVRRVIGAVHAGWRGTANGIAAKTVQKMQTLYGCAPDDILAAVGPSIGPCCFITDEDVPAAMRKDFGAAADSYIFKQGAKWTLDLKALNALHLNRAGVSGLHIAESDLCTMCRGDLFWSHRRDGAKRGSQAAMILL